MADTEETPTEDTNQLFSDESMGSGDQPMMSGLPSEYDGAPTTDGAAPAISTAEKPSGEKLFRLKLEDGQTFTGKTQEEVYQQLAKSKVEANRTINELKNRGTNVTVPPQTPQAPPSSTVTVTGYDNQKYLDMLGTNPDEAQEYWVKNSPSVTAQSIRESVKTSAEMKQKEVTMTFLSRNPDYVPSAENGNKLTTFMTNQGLPPTLVNFEWAFRELQRSHELQVPTAEETQEYEEMTFGNSAVPPVVPRGTPPKPPSRGAKVPPTPPSGGGKADVVAVDYETMPRAEFDALLRKNGVLRH